MHDSPCTGVCSKGVVCSAVAGLQHGVIRPSQPNGLPLDMKIIPNYLKEASTPYATYAVGKWHIVSALSPPAMATIAACGCRGTDDDRRQRLVERLSVTVVACRAFMRMPTALGAEASTSTPVRSPRLIGRCQLPRYSSFTCEEGLVSSQPSRRHRRIPRRRRGLLPAHSIVSQGGRL